MNAYLFHAETVEGGYISGRPLLSGRRYDVFGLVTPEQCRSGLTDYRKLFFTHQDGLAYRVAFWDMAGPIILALCKATDSDTVTDAAAYTAWKGSGLLTTATTEGAVDSLSISSLQATGFAPLDLVALTGGGHTEFMRVKTVSWAGLNAVITLMGGQSLNYSYETGARVSACLEWGNGTNGALWIKRRILTGTPPYADFAAYLRFNA